MANLDGTSTAEIEAPLDEVWALVQDVEIASQWQDGVNSMRAVERDDEGRAVLCDAENDAKVRTIKSRVRFDYSAAPYLLSWEQEKGDLKSVRGSWTLEQLDENRTRASYDIEVDLGRTLSMLVRGPLVGTLREMLAGRRAGELKARVEGSR